MISRQNRALALALLLSILAGHPLLAQDTFYEAYHLGLEDLEAGRLEAARAALLRAAELRPQAGRRVKAYGLNFLPVYEPYLPLAEAEARLGLLDAAEAHLRRARADGVATPARVEALAARLAAQRIPAAPAAATAPETPAPAPPLSDVKSPPVSRPAETVPEKLASEPAAAPPAQGSPAPVSLLPVAPVPRPASPLPQEERPRGPEPAPAHVESIDSTPSTDLAAREPSSSPSLSPSPSPAPAGPQTVQAPSPWPWIGGIGAVLAVLAAAALRKRSAAAPKAVPPPERSTLATQADGPTVSLTRPKPLPDGVSPDFGAYQLEGVLGAGGMARTYLATRRRDGLRVAIKLPHEHLLADEEGVARFLREGELGATLHHPNIVRIYEAGEHRGRPFLAMEYLQGPTLEAYLRAQGPLAVRPALEITRGIAVALDYAHLKGVIHRDLKPENVIVAEGMQIKVMDYGIARVLGAPDLTAPQTYLGTPLYSAPESNDPPQVDHQSDLYSLGIILYRMLAGAPPFVSTNPFELLALHRTSPLPPFPPERAIPAEVLALLSRLTAKEKRDRYPGAEPLLRDIDRLLHAL